MNTVLIGFELYVVLLGLVLLMGDLWTPAPLKRSLGYGAALGLVAALVFSFLVDFDYAQTAFAEAYVLDSIAIWFKRFFLLSGALVLVLQAEFSDRIESGLSEYYSLSLFALAGMMFAASANHFAVMFAAIELITITFYILTSFQRNRMPSLEAGIKYLILGGVSSAIMVYGIALIYGMTGTFSFAGIYEKAGGLVQDPIFLLGWLFVLVGLGFKIAAFPYQIWVPDVYQGAPAPTTAFLAVGSKAAGFALLLRLVYHVVPNVALEWTNVFLVFSALTILYGNLCAIPQQNVKRLFGYSSIAHAGYLLLGVAALNSSGASAVLYYLAGYLFTVVAAFAVLVVALRGVEGEDISSLAGLGRRSPFLAAAMTLSMASLAGIPPLAGFFGKFLIFRAALQEGADNHGFYCLVGVAIVGVAISIYYYFGILRVMYFSGYEHEETPIAVRGPIKAALAVCMAGMLFLGIFPNLPLKMAEEAAGLLSRI